MVRTGLIPVHGIPKGQKYGDFTASSEMFGYLRLLIRAVSEKDGPEMEILVSGKGEKSC